MLREPKKNGFVQRLFCSFLFDEQGKFILMDFLGVVFFMVAIHLGPKMIYGEISPSIAKGASAFPAWDVAN